MTNYKDLDFKQSILLDTAVEAVKTAGACSISSICNPVIRKFKKFNDVQLCADFEASELMTNVIHNNFPEHLVISEENDVLVQESYQDDFWVLDPIDGSNNIVIGIPYFVNSLSFFSKSIQRLAVIYSPLLREMYIAVSNKGMVINSEYTRFKQKIEPSESSISFVNNYSSAYRGLKFNHEKIIEKKCKRVTKMWAPNADLAQISRGRLAGMVCTEIMYRDICSGLMLVKESGGIITNFAGDPVEISSLKIYENYNLIISVNKNILNFLVEACRNYI